MKPLKIPAALAFAITATVAASTSCDDHGKHPDGGTCQVFCVYESVDNGNCPFPTCATGSNLDVCPQGCIPEPIA